MGPQSEHGRSGGAGAGATAIATTTGLPRPQSSLELLSQTAAVLEHSPQPSYSLSISDTSVVDLQTFGTASLSYSPKESARGVTPTNSSPRDLNMSKQAPSLPDMIKKPHQTLPVILEQKRNSFLPPPLLGEGAPDMDGRAGTPLHYSPGLFLTYSNGGTSSSGIWNHGGGGHGPPPIATETDSGSSDAGGDVVGPHFLTSQGSFTSNGSLASAPSYAFGGTSSAGPPAFAPPPLSLMTRPTHSFSASDDYQHENLILRQQLALKDAAIDLLQKQLDAMQQEIQELRQLPTGKISQIPVE